MLKRYRCTCMLKRKMPLMLKKPSTPFNAQILDAQNDARAHPTSLFSDKVCESRFEMVQMVRSGYFCSSTPFDPSLTD
jgi:hypothetical protein